MNTAPITLESLAVRVTALENTAKQNHETHGEIYARIEAVEKGHAILDTNLANIWKVLNEISADVKEMKARPARRYDKAVDTIVQWLIVGLLAAAIVFK